MALQYDTLPPLSIRLLELTESDDQSIGFKLTTHSFDKVPTFNALSYVWGVPPNPPIHHIRCINKLSLTGGLIPVGPNLYGALKPLKAFSKLPLWIDAVCINQGDLDEKAVQVPFMKEIYSAAKQVLVWLGPEADDSDLAIDSLYYMSKLGLSGLSFESLYDLSNLEISDLPPVVLPLSLSLRQLIALRNVLKQGDVVEISEEAYKHMNLPGFHHHLWKALSRLYFREWLSRLWTFQEVILATRAIVLCGNKFLSWVTFKEFGLALADTQLLYHTQHIFSLPTQRQTESMPPFTRLSSFRHQDPNGHWFWLYVGEGRFKECGFPEDRIYSLLGLAPATIRAGIVINYRQHYSIGYKQASKCFIKELSADVVLNIAASVGKPAQLPSWCPDYNAPPSPIAVWPRSKAGSHLAHLSFFEEDPMNDNIIRLGGIRCDTVSHVIDNYLWHWPPEAVAGVDGPAAKLLAWLDDCWALTLKTIGDEEQAHEAYWQTLFGNIQEKNVDQFPPSPIIGLKAFRIRLTENRASVPLSETTLTRNQLIALGPVLSYLGKLWRERIFFATTGGRLGFASRGIAQGDQCCILFGQPQVYLFRSRHPTLQQYEFMSVAFVHGLMLGNGYSSVALKDRQIFEIC